MLTRYAPTKILILLLMCVLGRTVAGQDTTVQENTSSLLTPRDAIQSIRDLHSELKPTIVLQNELDGLIDSGGGGACPIAAGLDALQTFRVMIGLQPHPDPHRVALELFTHRPALREGRISNDRFVSVVKSFSSQLEDITLESEVVSAPNSEHAEDGERWDESEGPDLTVTPGGLKVLSYTWTEANGTVLGRHFVLLQSISDDEIIVLDPNRPFRDYSYSLEYQPGESGPKGRLFLRFPEGVPSRGRTFEVNTVFRFSVDPSSNEFQEVTANSVAAINSKIDELADSLRQSGEFKSPLAWRREGAAFGLPGLDLPEALGGRNWPATKMVEVFRHAGSINLNLRDVIGGAHSRPLAKIETEFAREILQEVVEGRAYMAVAITEPTAGTDMRQMTSTAKIDGDDFQLSGEKLWNARLRQATHVVLYTQAANGEPGDRTAFLISIDHPGLEIVDRYAHGLTGNSFGGLQFENMHVGRESLLGEDGDGGRVFNEHFLYWRLMQAAAAVGCGEGALDQMAARIKERQAFGGPIGRFTHLQQPIGENLTKLRMAMALIREAAALIDQGNYEAAVPLVNGLKAEAVEIALEASDASMRAHGALGYSRDVDIGDRVRDLMGLRIADGTTDVMRMTVVRDEYGYEFWEMGVRSYRDPSSINDDQH